MVHKPKVASSTRLPPLRRHVTPVRSVRTSRNRRSSISFVIFVTQTSVSTQIAPNGMRVRTRYRSTAGLLQSRSAAERRNGCTSAGRVPNSCGRVFTNGQDTRSRSRFGHVPTTGDSASVARNTMPRLGPWPSNGFASCFAAGKIAWLMTKQISHSLGHTRFASDLCLRRNGSEHLKLLWILSECRK